MAHHEPNRWKGFVLGMAGGVAGLAAMEYFRKGVKAAAGGRLEGQKPAQEEHDVSLVGRQRRQGEPATAAIGRIYYTALAGKEPESEETKTTLSYLVHWGYGIKMGGWYGALRAGREGLDLQGGLAWGAALWAFGDEIAVPLLGLAEGPKAYPPALHAETLGAHLAYGAATAVATQLLSKIL